MQISFSSGEKIFRLDTDRITYAMMVGSAGELRHIYYGPSIGNDDISGLAKRSDRAFSPYPAGEGYDYSFNTAQLEFSVFGSGDFRNTAAVLRKSNGTAVTGAVYESHTITAGKAPLPGLPASFAPEKQCRTLEIILKDAFSGARFVLRYSIFADSDVIARSVKVVNPSAETLRIEKLMSAQLDFDSADFDMLYFHGHWAYERHARRTPLQPGMQGFRSARGSSGHQYNPSVALVSKDASERHGDVYAMVLLYSGSFAAETEVDEFSAARTMLGINRENFQWNLKPGEEFNAPEALLMYSAEGFGGISAMSHRFFMNHVLRSRWTHRKRPILVNNWEATYFDFDESKIYALAEQASRLGIEMLVLDDGWFGERNDDHTSLGDWFVNTKKLGDFNGMVRKINALGMKFGLWFEPEMISEKSELYKKHPEWVLHVPGFPRSLSRNQLVLDMSRKEVVDYLFGTISALIRDANIEYIKWDMNRSLTEIHSAALPPEQQGETAHRYVLGVYELHERLLQTFPDLLIEGCSGGGGRFDAGMLYYVPQIWCSDDSDAVERVPIQLGTSFYYPCSTMGAHVSACPNHQTGRSTSFKFRGDVALAGTFGYELDVTSLGEEEKTQIREQIAQYHKYNDLIREGSFYRITENFGLGDTAAWCWVSENRNEVLAVAVRKQDEPCSQSPVFRMRIPGLDAEKQYVLESTGYTAAGSTLMHAGLNIGNDLRGDASSMLYYFTAK